MPAVEAPSLSRVPCGRGSLADRMGRLEAAAAELATRVATLTALAEALEAQLRASG